MNPDPQAALTKERIAQIYKVYADDGVLLLINLRSLCDMAERSLTLPADVAGAVVSVPKEPTEEMIKAGWTAWADCGAVPDRLPYAYRAMLSAAPQPTEDSNER